MQIFVYFFLCCFFSSAWFGSVRGNVNWYTVYQELATFHLSSFVMCGHALFDCVTLCLFPRCCLRTIDHSNENATTKCRNACILFLNETRQRNNTDILSFLWKTNILIYLSYCSAPFRPVHQKMGRVCVCMQYLQ